MNHILIQVSLLYKPSECQTFYLDRTCVLFGSHSKMRGSLRISGDIDVEITAREARRLPVSLLMSTDPEEQVVQFLVANHKPRPMGRAFLSTVVSTTLSNSEKARVAVRLKDGGIEVEEYQAVAYVAQHPQSPFRNRVEPGMVGDAKDLLEWDVLASLVRVFRHLKGGRLFGQRNDYAGIWEERFLPSSEIAANFAEQGCVSRTAYWRSLDGPWRDVFVAFWTEVRDTFGNTQDPDEPNYWGRPGESNLFNRVSLKILAADFFQFLVETRTKLASADQVPGLVHSWLEGVNRGYFDRDLALVGVRRDSVGIRNHWASIWTDYRKRGGILPDQRLFRRPGDLSRET